MTVRVMLKPRWARWKRSRVRELTAAGVPIDTALRLAGGEARGGQLLAPIIGVKSADEAQLICIDEVAGRFALSGALTGLSDSQIDRLYRFNARIL